MNRRKPSNRGSPVPGKPSAKLTRSTVTDPTDDLEAILAPSPPSASPGLHDAILQRTQRVLHRRRIMVRATRIGVLAAVFAVGLGTGRESRTSHAAVEYVEVNGPP